ncbi:DNA-binding IclR family transcriptional regulator [Kribbella aluminosa]|uniref:DNA-binding IclR family transcriptional regulator n=1 Tax=Kribbella aluminosa TaxID=416017 RepID=A0ABS4UJ26_9ACTN|nr:IclR family transcriptional regulator [Kribbella aluminosa]MBP2351667.1 DNA-binding IclR family transcriptional regulator [Kribbella aluminosa]
MSALDRCLSILDFMATTSEATVADISASLGISRSATYRLMERLRLRGYLEEGRITHTWALGPAAARLAMAAVHSTDVARAAPEYLRMLVQQTRETVSLGVPRGREMVFIYRERGPRSVGVSADVGVRRPMYCTSVGKAYLAALPADHRSSLLDRVVLHRYTEATVADRSALEADLARTAERGWAQDLGELDVSSACCGAVVRDNLGRPIAAISVAGPADRMVPELARVGPIVASTAEAISRRLGYDPEIEYAPSAPPDLDGRQS